MTKDATDKRSADCDCLQQCDVGNGRMSAVCATSSRGVINHPNTSVLPSSAHDAAAQTTALNDVTGYAYLAALAGTHGT